MMPLRLGADVNPVAREVTHLAVDPKRRFGPGRLVPIDLMDAATGQIRLRCTLAESQTLRRSEETEGVPDLDPSKHAHTRVQKQHGVGGILWSVRDPDAPQAPREVTVDYVPPGAIEVHRELTVCATDGNVGQVQGLVVEPGGHQVTHVLLQQGRMRGRKEVAIPIGAVTKMGTLLIHLSLTKHQVKDLPPVDIDHPAR